MKRLFAIISCAAVLLALVPATASAARPTRYSDHSVSAFCEGPVEGGVAAVDTFTSTAFGDGAEADIWLDPAVAFEDPPSISGSGATVDRVETATSIVLTTTFTAFDSDGDSLGDAVLTMTLAAAGDPEAFGPDAGKSNHHSTTHGISQPLEGSATLSLPGLDAEFPDCSGSVDDIDVFETNPHSSVFSNQGVVVDCFWMIDEDSFATFFAIDDDFGLSADASLTTPDVDLHVNGPITGSLTASAVSMSLPLVDSNTGDPSSATATATFTHIGSPHTSTIISQDARTKTTQQALAAHGSVAFGTGDSFEMDADHCRANAFSDHSQRNTPAGPKPGVAPANDLPEGAIHLTSRSKPNVLTGGTALDAEVPNLTCPAGTRDAMGHTVWYTVTGTGHPITIDTGGSDFDTVAAVFEPVADGINEIACDDDVDFVPIGTSYQAVVTFDSVAGVDYLVEVGGIVRFFDGDAESGRLRLTVR